MTSWDDKRIEQTINRAVDKAVNKVVDRASTKAAEDAVGFYYEKTRHDFELTWEALDAMKQQVDKIPGIEADVAELKGDMRIIKQALKATNIDVQKHNKRITNLEGAVFHA